jgi:transposase, IS5 family
LVQIVSSIPWDEIVCVYERHLNNSKTGSSNINPRVIIGALMVKHLLNTSDRDTIIAIQENIYIQHFIGFDTIIFEAPFNASLFVEIRKRMGLENIEKINDLIYTHSVLQLKKASDSYSDNDYDNTHGLNESPEESGSITTGGMRTDGQNVYTHSGKLLIDATVFPQNITYPTDLKLMNASREKTEEIIDKLHNSVSHEFKRPRTYREEARQRYLLFSKKKVRTRKEFRKVIG